jgi:2-polyprenyl-6-hydroxyphenyl methylase/3-demethylubiquinone-9 3-methyltransferase
MSLRWKIAQYAEIRWWQNYLKGKDSLQYLDWKSEYWKRFLSDCEINPEAQSDCLDAGCGPAGIFTILKSHKTDAFDPLLELYEQKLKIFKKENYPEIKFYNNDLENFKSEKNYNYVFCLNAVNHVKDWEKSISKLVQLTKNGGKLIISTDVHRFRILKYVFRLLPGDILHPQQHQSGDYLQFFNSFKPLSVKKILLKKGNIFNYEVFILEF